MSHQQRYVEPDVSNNSASEVVVTGESEQAEPVQEQISTPEVPESVP
jgi:hypothetical protein